MAIATLEPSVTVLILVNAVDFIKVNFEVLRQGTGVRTRICHALEQIGNILHHFLNERWVFVSKMTG